MGSTAGHLDRSLALASAATIEQSASPWCLSPGKRVFDCCAAAVALAAVAVPIAVIALAVRLTSPGPAFFRHRRAGLKGHEFELLKFRSMRHNAAGPGITVAGDSRVTRVGAWLRRTKLDELPQLFNVLSGELSLVGPRPDLLRYWQAASDEERRVLQLKPGVTSLATLHFRHEEELLTTFAGATLEDRYVNELLPMKAAMELEYARRASFSSDLCVLLLTIRALLRN